MLDLMYDTPYLEDGSATPAHTTHIPATIVPLRAAAPRHDDLEARLRLARPRLLRLARALGVPADAADGVVQEVLLGAWRGRDRLRQAGRFDAWLTAITRNHARMYLRSHGAAARAHRAGITLIRGEQAGGNEEDEAHEVMSVPDPLVLDPFDALDRQDLERLLDRALGHLPAPARRALELRYLADLPEREVAAELGVSVPTLEARLHRARRQMRGVLAGPLRAEAEAAGLPLDTAPPAGWQETRLWCNLCGRRRLRGTFERRSDGRRELRLRCPDCSERYGVDIYGSKGVVPLDDPRSFRPALTRTMRALAEQTLRTLETGQGVCSTCGAPARQRIVGPDEVPLARTIQQHVIVTECRNPACKSCGDTDHQDGMGGFSHVQTAVEPALWLHRDAQHFMAEHPRWITQPETIIDYEGRPAIRFALADAVGAARLTALADLGTLRILATSLA